MPPYPGINLVAHGIGADLAGQVDLDGAVDGSDLGVALDAAATEMFDPASGSYVFEGSGERVTLSPDAMVDMYAGWLEAYPIVSIEDGLGEDDWEGWAEKEATTTTSPSRKLSMEVKSSRKPSVEVKPYQLDADSPRKMSVEAAPKSTKPAKDVFAASQAWRERQQRKEVDFFADMMPAIEAEKKEGNAKEMEKPAPTAKFDIAATDAILDDDGGEGGDGWDEDDDWGDI